MEGRELRREEDRTKGKERNWVDKETLMKICLKGKEETEKEEKIKEGKEEENEIKKERKKSKERNR